MSLELQMVKVVSETDFQVKANSWISRAILMCRCRIALCEDEIVLRQAYVHIGYPELEDVCIESTHRLSFLY